MPPSHADYTKCRTIAGTFENQALYKMCLDQPRHDDAYHVEGKLIAIGRIYAASIERGAGKPNSGGISVLKHVAECFANSRFELDNYLNELPHDKKLEGGAFFKDVIECHKYLVDSIKCSIESWKDCVRNERWTPLAHASFASKYLHFHKPNAFPIMDSFADKGLQNKGLKGAYSNYEKFCSKVLKISNGNANWTLRSIDTELVDIGRSTSRRQ